MESARRPTGLVPILRHGSRTIDYPFTLIELHIGPDGKGEGKMSMATKIMYDKTKNEVVLENYQSQPVLLTEVHKEAK